MAAPTRFPSGVTNVEPPHPLGMYGAPDPAKFHQFFDDFDTYLASDWTITGTPGTVAMGALDGGVITLTNGAADNNSTFLQGAQSFLGEVGKRLWFGTRLKLNTATQVDVVAGLYVTTADPVAALPTDGIFFFKDDGDANLDFHVRNGGTSTTAVVATLADDTFADVGFAYNGKDEVGVFVNAVKVSTFAVTNFPSADLLRASFGVQNGEAVAKILTMDRVFASKERG